MIIRKLEDLFLPMLRKCSNMVELKKIHAHIIKLSLSQSNFLATKMVDVCDENGDTGYAILLFKQMLEPNIFMYNALVRTHAHNQIYTVAITIYREMLRHPEAQNPIFPDKFTFPFVVKSCVGIMCRYLGRQVHGHLCKFGPKSNITTGNSLIDMYAKFDDLLDAGKVFEEMADRDAISWNCLISGHVRMGQMKRARALFEEMPVRTIVSWTAIITGYARIGCYSEALDVFREMQMVGLKPDEISITAALHACAHLGALELGNWIHFYAGKNGFLRKTYFCNALIEMYAKCGCIDEAFQLFDKMPERDVISWSTMIGGLANHGKAKEAIELFHEMERDKVEPNSITFLSLLSACTHAGFLNEGLHYFDSMREDYHIEPEIEHYSCLVDILGRAGCLDRALHLVTEMPMKPDAAIWGSLLSSCRTHRNLEIATASMDRLLELEPDDTGNYVLLSNIYADLGKWEGVSKMRKLIRSKSMKKTPGCSSIEVNSKVEEFASGDDSKQFSQDIYWMLKLLSWHQSKSRNVIETILEDGS